MSKKIALLLFCAFVIWSTLFWPFQNETNHEHTAEEKEQLRHQQIDFQRQIFTVGTVGNDREKELSEFQGFTQYLAKELHNMGIEQGGVVVAESPVEIAKLMRQGLVDLYIDSPFPAYVVSQLADAKPLANQWRDGQETYRSVLFVRTESDIESIDDLAGKTIAFETDYSTSGYFLPKASLLQHGLSMTHTDNIPQTEGPNTIGYYFSETSAQTILDVENGIADAGADNEEDFQKFSKYESDQYRIIFTSPEIFRHIVIVAKDMPDDMEGEIKKILTDIHTSAEGKSILNAFDNTGKFSLVDSHTSEKVFEIISTLSAFVEREIIEQ